MITINYVQCRNCGDRIYSRAIHDFHYCRCGLTSIDGGFDYFHVGWQTKGSPKRGKFKLTASKQELYDDWNERLDKYGNLDK
jgi:hypothetical protein